MARLNPARWLGRLLPARRWRVVTQVEEADLVPDRLPRRGAALAGPPGAPKWLALDCPCGSGHRLLVNLDTHRRPAWHLVSARPLTVRPSLDVTQAGNRCHFTIISGTVHWAESGQQTPRGVPSWLPQGEKNDD
jgi:hypothetical protein